MKKTKHKPPSRIKYEKANPMTSFRLTKDIREDIDLLKLPDESYATFFRKVAINGVERLDKVAMQRAYENGYAAARRKYEVKYNCDVCGEEIALTSSSKAVEEIRNFLTYRNL